MQVCCPVCDAEFPIEAGFIEGDGKRLAALLAEAEPALGRALVGYLRLFKPAKTALRVTRAAKLAGELLDLVRAGEVSRAGSTRRTAPGLWIAGIEQMLATRDRLRLPLSGHGYLAEVVFALADRADAAIERQREEDRRVGRGREGSATNAGAPLPASALLAGEIDYARRMVEYGAWTPEESDAHIAKARQKHTA
jgi:hypothetical protein